MWTSGPRVGRLRDDGEVPALTEPVTAEQARALRAAVQALKAGGRRVEPPALRVGRAGGPAVVHVIRADEVLDEASRTEVMAALLLRSRELAEAPVVWLTRTGEPEWHDLDAAWLPAAVAAYAEAEVPLVFVVVTRHGWYDPRSGVTRRWRRLRDRRPTGALPVRSQPVQARLTG